MASTISLLILPLLIFGDLIFGYLILSGPSSADSLGHRSLRLPEKVSDLLVLKSGLRKEQFGLPEHVAPSNYLKLKKRQRLHVLHEFFHYSLPGVPAEMGS